MKKGIALAALLCLLAACAAGQGGPSAGAALSAQAVLSGMADTSRLYAVSPDGAAEERLVSEARYTHGQLSPDGARLLVRVGHEAVAESVVSGWAVCPLDGGEPALLVEEHGGLQPLTFLSADTLAYAWGNDVYSASHEGRPLQFYSAGGQDIAAPFPFDTADPARALTGIAHEAGRYALALAADRAAEGEPFSANALQLALFEGGVPAGEIAVAGMQSPYSQNVLTLLPNPPSFLPDGRLLVAGQPEGTRQQVLLAVDPASGGADALPFGALLARSGALLLVEEDFRTVESPRVLLVRLREAGDYETLAVLTGMPAKGMDDPFQIRSGAMDAKGCYLLADVDADAPGRALLYFSLAGGTLTKLCCLPQQGDCNLAGIDQEGRALLLCGKLHPDMAADLPGAG